MSEPVWITREIVLAVQSELIARFGGLNGLRNEGLLDSALNRPRQLWRYAQADLPELAAVYAEALVKNHLFLDGNKRVGFMMAYTFLAANGLQFVAPEEQAVLQTLALAAGEIDGEDYALWLADHSVPRGKKPARKARRTAKPARKPRR